MEPRRVEPRGAQGETKQISLVVPFPAPNERSCVVCCALCVVQCVMCVVCGWVECACVVWCAGVLVSHWECRFQCVSANDFGMPWTDFPWTAKNFTF